MRKTYVYYDVPAITHELIDRVRTCMSLEEIHEMWKRRNEVVGNMFFDGHKDRLLAIEVFERGYISGLIEIKKPSHNYD